MDKPAIEQWLVDEFSKRFQTRIGECLTTLIWFDPDRYWLPSIPWLSERSAHWTFSPEEGRKVPMTMIAVGSHIPEGKGQSPLNIRLSILKDRISNAEPNGSFHFQKISRWIIYCPFPPDWLNEATRPRKTIPLSWLMPFCEAGLEWGRRGGDEEKLPAFLRAHGLDLTKDKKQLTELYHLTNTDHSASPISRLVAQNLEKPREFWEGKSWDLKKVQDELVGDLGRQTEELLVDPEATVARLRDEGALNDFLSRLEDRLGSEWNPDTVAADPVGFSQELVRHVALSTTWKVTGFNTAFPFSPEMPPPYKTEHCEETIIDWLKIAEVAAAYVEKCRSLEKEGLNLLGSANIKKRGHVFPHIILKQWHEVRETLESVAGASVKHIRNLLKDVQIENHDEAWDRLMPGDLGWDWLSSLKEIEERVAEGESWLMTSDADGLELCFKHYTDPDSGWWKIDEMVRKLMVFAVDTPDGDLIKALTFPLYDFWIAKTGQHFTEIIIEKLNLQSQKKIPRVDKGMESVWSLPEGKKRKAIIVTDALRYDLSMAVGKLLKKSGFKVDVKPWLAELPSKTEVGMSRLLPCCDLEMQFKDKKYAMIHNGKDFGVKSNRLSFLKQKFGLDLTPLEMNEVTKSNLKKIKSKILAIFTRDIDSEGEAKGLGLFKDIEKELTEIVSKIQVLAQCGYHEIHVVTDHGFLLSSSDRLVKWDSPGGAMVCGRRFAIVSKHIGTELPAIPSPWDDEHWLALPPAGTVFKAGGQTEFLHGGASFQETIIPHIRAEVQDQAVYVTVTMMTEKDVIDSGIVKVDLKGKSTAGQLPFSFMPAMSLPRTGFLVAERKGKTVSKPKNFELGDGDHLKLTLFLDRGLKQGDEIAIISRDGEELLATKTLRVTRNV